MTTSRLAAIAGFAVPVVLLALTLAAQVTNALQPIGWDGPEYLVAFLCIALGSAVAGSVVKAATRGPWRAAGNGMVLVGLFGVVLWVLLVVTIFWGLGG